MPRHARLVLPALVLTAAVLSAGCDLLGRYMSRSPQDALADAALAAWAAPGHAFLEGVAGQDTVASVSATGARAWEVAVVPPAGGSPRVWSLDFPRIEIYPVFPGPGFVPWLEDRARELGMRTFIPSEVSAQVREGAILSVGDLEVRFGPADRSGRNTEAHLAYLVPAGPGEDARWALQPTSRSASVLMEALRKVTDDLVRRDDRVLTCMGSASPAGVPRDKQLECVREVLTEQFGGD